MISLETGATFRGKAGTATAITYTLLGDEINTSAGTDSFKTLAQGQLGTSTATLYTVPGSTQTLIREIHLANTTGSPVTGVTFFVNGSASTNQLNGGLSIPAGGSAIFANNGWVVSDSAGGTTPTLLTLSGDVTGSGNSTIVTTIANDAVTNSRLANVASGTFKGRVTAATGDPEDLTGTQATTLLDTATTSLKGLQSATDKTKEDNIWIDVTANTTANMSTGGTATANTTALNAIIAAAASGSVIYFPPGFYNLNGKISVGAKALKFQGAFSGISGGLSALVWTSNVADNLIQLTDNNWYSSFNDLNFINNGATQSAGAVIFVGSNAFTNIRRCTFGALSGQLNRCIDYTGANSGISSIVEYCQFTGFNDVGIYQGGNLGTIIVTECTMNGAQDTSTIGIQVRIGGAMLISDCDIIGCNNNLLIDPLVGTVVASVYVNNTYFDSSQGSCIKITGAGATVRTKFTSCQFTTAASASPNNGVEVSSTYNYGSLGMGLDFTNCNVLNTFSSGGSPSGTGFNITGAGDFSINNCNIALWTVGIDVTPATTAGMTQPVISNNSIGPCGGYGANTTGVRFNAGATTYGLVKVTGNVLSGNVTAITDASSIVAGGQKLIDANVGLALGAALGAQVSLTTITQILSAPIPAGSVRVGTTWRIRGTWGRATADTGTTTINATIGTAGTTADGTVCSLVPAHTLVANQAGEFIILVTCRAIGAGATSFAGTGKAALQTNATNSAATLGSYTRGQATVLGALSSGNAMFIGVNATHATNAVTFDNVVIEVLQQ